MDKIKILWISALLTAVVVCFQINIFPEFKKVNDAQSYISMAEGHSDKALLHHARRILHPWIVGQLRSLVGTDSAFIIIGILSLFLFLTMVLYLLCFDLKLLPLTSVTLIFMPYLFSLFHDCYIQTLFFLSLASVYFFLLIRKKYFLSILMLAILLLTRDEALIYFIAFMILTIMKIIRDPKKAQNAFYLAMTGALGIFCQVFIAISTRANTNLHHLPHFLASLLRIPLFYVRNFTGLSFWFDTYNKLPEYTHSPLWSMDAPKLVQKISVIKKMGIYEWDIMPLILTLLSMASVFGIGSLLWYYIVKKKANIKNLYSLAFGTIFFSGSFLFLLAPGSGPAAIRYYICAWPLFFLIMPLFFVQIKQLDKKLFNRLMLIYVLSAWLVFPLFFNLFNTIFCAVLLLIEATLHGYTWHLLQEFSRKTGHSFNLEASF